MRIQYRTLNGKSIGITFDSVTDAEQRLAHLEELEQTTRQVAWTDSGAGRFNYNAEAEAIREALARANNSPATSVAPTKTISSIRLSAHPSTDTSNLSDAERLALSERLWDEYYGLSIEDKNTVQTTVFAYMFGFCKGQRNFAEREFIAITRVSLDALIQTAIDENATERFLSAGS